MICYQCGLDGMNESHLTGFFVGWPSPPSKEYLFRILQGSYRCVLAVDSESGSVVGFLNCISDGLFSAFFPLLEVLPDFQGQGIGKELVRLMEKEVAHVYSKDFICDRGVAEFYEKIGYVETVGMSKRNYKHIAFNRPKASQ